MKRYLLVLLLICQPAQAMVLTNGTGNFLVQEKHMACYQPDLGNNTEAYVIRYRVWYRDAEGKIYDDHFEDENGNRVEDLAPYLTVLTK